VKSHVFKSGLRGFRFIMLWFVPLDMNETKSYNHGQFRWTCTNQNFIFMSRHLDITC